MSKAERLKAQQFPGYATVSGEMNFSTGAPIMQLGITRPDGQQIAYKLPIATTNQYVDLRMHNRISVGQVPEDPDQQRLLEYISDPDATPALHVHAVDEPSTPFSRHRRFMIQSKNPYIVTLSGISMMLRADHLDPEDTHVVMSDPVMLPEDLTTFAKDHNLPTMGTLKVHPNGETETVMNNDPLGCYRMADLETKIKNTAWADKFLCKQMVVPKFTSYGTFTDLQFQGEAVGWGMYTMPPVIWAPELFQLSKWLDTHHPFIDPQSQYPGNNLYEGFLAQAAMAMKFAHSKEAVHYQFHPGNLGWAIGQGKVAVTDWQTMMNIFRHNQKPMPNLRFSAHQRARMVDLTNFLLSTFKTMGHSTTHNSVDAYARMASWITVGYRAKPGSKITHQTLLADEQLAKESIEKIRKDPRYQTRAHGILGQSIDLPGLMLNNSFLSSISSNIARNAFVRS